MNILCRSVFRLYSFFKILLNSSVQNFCVRGGKEAWRILSEPNPWFQCVAWKQEVNKTFFFFRIYLKNSILPKLMSKHFLKKWNHWSERICQSVVCLLEGNDEYVDIFYLVPENGDQALDSLLLFHQVVPEPRCVKDCEPLLVFVPHPISMISTCILSNAV